MAQSNSNQPNQSSKSAKATAIKWVAIIIVTIIICVVVYFAFIKKGKKDMADSTMVYQDNTGRTMPVCNLSPSTAYAISTWDPTQASMLSMPKCKSTVNKQCKKLPAGNARSVCKTELVGCVCSKNGGNEK